MTPWAEISEGHRLRALREAKCQLYEAYHQARASGDDMAERIGEEFNRAERLFLDAKSKAENRESAYAELMTAEYGPKVS